MTITTYIWIVFLTLAFLFHSSLTYNTTRDRHEQPTLLDTSCSDENPEWTKIVFGTNHTVLPRRENLFSWGMNNHGQLGHGDMKHRGVPTKGESLDGIVIIIISCGVVHTAALTDKGEIFTWYVRSC